MKSVKGKKNLRKDDLGFKINALREHALDTPGGLRAIHACNTGLTVNRKSTLNNSVKLL